MTFWTFPERVWNCSALRTDFLSSQLICTCLKLLLICASLSLELGALPMVFIYRFIWTALSLRLGLLSTRICQENGAFPKRSSNRRNLKTQLLVFVWTDKILKEAFENDGVIIIMVFLFMSFTQSKIQNDQWLFRFETLRRCVDGKHLMRFQSGNAIFKFLRCNVNGATVIMHRNWRMNALQHAWCF